MWSLSHRLRSEGGIVSILQPRIEGSWEECNREDCTQIFFRYPFGHKCYSLSDKIGVCNLCIFSIKKVNGTLPNKDEDISKFVHHKSNDSKPEGDTL